MSGFAQQLDQSQNSEFQSMANRGFNFAAGGETLQNAGVAAVAEAGQSLQDTGSGLLGTAVSVGLGRAVITKVAQAKKVAQAARQALRGGEESGGDSEIAETSFATDADGAASSVAPAGGDAAGAAGSEITTATAEGGAEAGEVAGGILTGGADAEEVLAASGVGETPVGLVAMAGVGLVMGIAGFFLHRHAEKHATKTTPVVQEQQGASNYFVQAGV